MVPSQTQYEIRDFMMGGRGAALRLLAAAFALTVLTAQISLGQTFNVIHNFNIQYGQVPLSGMTMDRGGNFYGTTYYGGNNQEGVVYKLTPAGAGWIFTPLYSFTGGSDGAHPAAGITIGPDGALYGSTLYGGGGGCSLGCGTVYRISPPPTTCQSTLCNWMETVLYRFSGGADGGTPNAAVIFDRAGNLYGTALSGGLNNCGAKGCGAVYKLTRSGNTWTESVLYSFTGGADGALPKAAVVLDSAGNLYSTTLGGGSDGQGVVFQLHPSGSGWIENVLYTFTGGADGGAPIAGLIFDNLGNLYGASANGGAGLCKVFELSPSGGNWSFALVYSFDYTEGANCAANLTLDNLGNLYGTTAGGGTYEDGVVFELSPSGGNWAYTALHEFTGGSDGEDASSTPIFDAHGNLYGTAPLGGSYGAGVIFQITP